MCIRDRVRGFGGDIFYNDKMASGGGYFADRNLFEIFDYKLIEGDPNTALNAPRSLVISEALSKQLFYNRSRNPSSIEILGSQFRSLFIFEMSASVSLTLSLIHI